LSEDGRRDFSQRPVSGDELYRTGVYHEHYRQQGWPINEAQIRKTADRDARVINGVDEAFRHAVPSTGPVRLSRRFNNAAEIFGRTTNMTGLTYREDGHVSTIVEDAKIGLYEAEVTIYVDTGARLIYMRPFSSNPREN